MSMLQNCKCKSCGHEWKIELFSFDIAYKNDYRTQYCDKCKLILEYEKRNQYFENNPITAELEDYIYTLNCIRNSDAWIIDDNPLCTIEATYLKCIEMVDNVLIKYNK